MRTLADCVAPADRPHGRSAQQGATRAPSRRRSVSRVATLLAGTVTLSAAAWSGTAFAGDAYLSGTTIVDGLDYSEDSVTGGTGSGGGAGLGGAIFIGDGATVIVDGVNFYGNTATGGQGGIGDVGGSLNGWTGATSNGINGGSGYDSLEGSGYFGGNGFGGSGQIGGTGGNATNGTGGSGGRGGVGGDGSSNTADTIKGVLQNAKTIFDGAGDSTVATLYTTLATEFAAASAAANASVPPNAALSTALAAVATAMGSLATEATASAAEEVTTAAWENVWLVAVQVTGYEMGVSGGGGAGGTGGAGGSGSYGYGGGAGGDGGDGGDAASGIEMGGSAPGGAGGSGGSGGAGGFGAGGGKGGDGGSGGDDAVDAQNGDHDGSGGSGGSAGFGAGVGSTGDGTTNGTDGGGGSGYGGAIFVQSGGKLTLKGDITFEGNEVFGGESANGGDAGQAAGSDLFMMTGSTVVLDPGAGHVITFNGTIADDSAASIDGSAIPAGKGAGLEVASGRVIFNNYNTYSGQTKISGGVLQADDGVGINDKSNINFAGGILQTSGTFDRYVGTASDRVQWTGSGGFAAIGDDLTVRLNGGQKLKWDSGSFVPDGSSLLFGSDSADSDVYFLNAIDLNGGTRTIVNNGGAAGENLLYLNGVISNGGLTLGDGTTEGIIVLSAANTYAGGTTVASGTTVRLGANGSFGSSSEVSIEGTLDISEATSGASVVTLSGDGDVKLGTKTLTVTNGSTTYSGEISGTGGLKIAGGNQTLSGTNIFTGPTTIDTGATLSLSGTGSIATSSSVTANGTLDISGTSAGAEIVALLGAGHVVLGSDPDGRTLTITEASGTFSGDISGDGGLTIEDGTQTLSGLNTYTGKTDIKADATLALSGSGSIDASKQVIADGTLDISSTTSGAAIVTLSGGGSVALGDQTLSISNGSTSFAGVIAGSGGLTITDGDQKLTGVNTYTGDTTIDAGAKLELDGAGSIAASQNVIANGIFDIADANGAVSVKTLLGSGSVVLGSNDLKLTAGLGTFGGVISGSGGVSLESGSFGLSGTNTYTGKTTVKSGTTLSLQGNTIAASSELALAGTADISFSIGSVGVNTLSGDGTLRIGTGDFRVTNGSTTFTGDIEGEGSFTVTGGTQTLSAITSNMGVTASGGTIVVSGGSISGGTSEAALNISNGGTITTSNVALTASNSILYADFDTGGKVANFTLGSGTVIAANNAVLLQVDRSGAGSDGVVNLVIDTGSAANGDIIDDGVLTGTGGTNVTVKAGSSWTGLANVTGFDIQAGAAVVFENGSIVDGTLTAAAGSSLFGGTVSAPLTVTGTAYIEDGAITGNIYIEGSLALNGLLSPGASPGAISVGVNVDADDYANSKFEVIYGTATQVAGTTYDQLNIGGDLNGELPLELARYGSTRGDALGDLSTIDLIRVGGTVNGSVVQTNRFTQNGHELFITQRTETASNSATVIHTPKTEEEFFGPGAVTVFGIDSVVQDETYVLATLPGSLNLATDTILGTYADRRGAALKSASTSGWVRAGYSGTQIDNGLARQEELYYSQAGFRLFSAGGFEATALGSYGNLKSDVATELGTAGLSGNMMAGGLELSLASGGGYVDAVGQYGYSNWTVTPTDASSLTITGQTLTGSIEAGYALGDASASVTPWVQLAYSASTFSDMESQWVDAVEFTDGQSATIRGGLRAQFDIGGVSPYAGAALAYDYYDHQDVVVDNFQLGTDNGGPRVELTAGMDANLAENVQFTSDFKGSYGITQTDVEISYEGSAGLRATW